MVSRVMFDTVTISPTRWPQFSIPTFKILSSECLQKVRIGEQICLVRSKLSWPFSAREAIVHFFEFEYFQDDLIFVLFNSISDLESNDKSGYGYSKDVIPDKKDVIRIDVLGGLAMQKVSANRSYFRTIANMDTKLDFVPPSVINFISRQLIGSGFMLYKKEVASVSRGDEDFKKALEDPLHCRIREALYSNNKQPPILQSEITNDTLPEDEADVGSQTVTEIEEVEEVKDEKVRELEENENEIRDLTLNNKSKEEEKSCSDSNKRKVSINPQVKQALETLETAISLFQDYRNSNASTIRSSSSLQKRVVEEPKPSEEGLKGMGSSEVSKENNIEKTLHEPRISFGSRSSRLMGSIPYIRETNHSNNIASASPEVNHVHPSESQRISLNEVFSFHRTGVEASVIFDNSNKVDDKQHASASMANGSHVVTES